MWVREAAVFRIVLSLLVATGVGGVPAQTLARPRRWGV